MSAGTVFILLPIVFLFAAATQPSDVLALEGFGFRLGSEGPSNVREVLSARAGFSDQISAASMLINSSAVALSLAILTTVMSLLAAYAVVYFKFPLAHFLFWLTMVTLLLPLESRLVTTFQVASVLGLVNTLTGMVLPALALALGTLFFRQLLLTIPDEYLEAARLDGAGPIRFFVDFIVPLTWRRGGAVFVVSFMIGWHQYLWPLILSTDESTYTVVRGIALFNFESGPGMALAALSLLPPLLLVIIFQRYFFQSLADTRNSF